MAIYRVAPQSYPESSWWPTVSPASSMGSGACYVVG
jgi:hypothetical protein